jgi:branched-chain amino acid transport system ATP-binding protein
MAPINSGSTQMIKVDTLKVAYGRIEALHGVSISVGHGEIVTIIGANGAGKSTLLRAICGVLPSRAGSIRFDGADVTRLASPDMIRRGVAMVPEGRHVFPEMTVRENLDLGAYYRRDASATRSDFERVLALFPVLREKLSTPGGLLSGGQQQMVALGRALMSRPRLLLLDEPSLGLAPTIVQQLGRVIGDLNKAGTTVLLVEQNARMALRLAHRAYVLATGLVARTGTGEELLHDPAVREMYLGGVSA